MWKFSSDSLGIESTLHQDIFKSENEAEKAFKWQGILAMYIHTTWQVAVL